MLKPTRTVLALAAGSLVLGLVGAGAAVADEGPTATTPSQSQSMAADDGVDGLDNGYTEERNAIGRVISRGPLKVRSRPTTRSEVLGQVQPNRRVEIECKSYGESVDGNRIWYRLRNEYGAGPEAKAYGKERWVAARYVENLTQVRYCR